MKQLTEEQREQEKTLRRSLTRYDLRVTFKCPGCQFDNSISFSDVYYNSDSSDCECCGSHGYKKVDFSCSKCRQYFEIVDSW